MAEPKSIPILPCPGGMNNVLHGTHQVFQVRQTANGAAPPLAVKSIVDFDLDSDGMLSARPGVVQYPMSYPLGLWSVAGRLFKQSGDVLYEGDTLLVQGLVGRVSIAEHWGYVYLTDGLRSYWLDSETVRPWGLPVPTVTLTAATGALAAGRYLVQVSFSDALGNEGGASAVASIVLATAGGFQVNVAGARPGATHANIYVGEAEQKHTSFLCQVALSALPYTVTSVRVSVADPPKTEQMIGPIVGAEGLFSFRAFLLMWRGQAVFRSEGAEPQLFHPYSIMQFPDQVKACAGVAGGLWIGTARGLWWVQGEDPSGWIPVQRSTQMVAWNAGLIDAAKIPKLQMQGTVALFATTRGLVVGTADGQLIELTDQYHFDLTDDSRASFAFVERDGLQQLVVAIAG